MIPYTQQIHADPERGDGHDANGVPGDCWKACVASLLDVADYDSVPHFVALDDWWGETTRYVWATTGHSLRKWRNPSIIPEGIELLIGLGPPPRADFYHAVIVDRAGGPVHDPHPSRRGLLAVEEFFAPIQDLS